MDELFEQFLIEGRELIALASDDLLALERDPAANGRIESAFRAVHTLKGSVAIFDLAPMGAALHAAEDLLGAVRGSTTRMDVSVAQALIACLDQCDRWMDSIEEQGTLPIEASKEAMRIANGLAALSGGGAEENAAQRDHAASEWVEALIAGEAPAVAAARSAGARLMAIRYVPREDCFFSGDDPLAIAASIPETVALRISPREPWPALDSIDPYRCNLVIEAVSQAAEADLRALFRFIPDQVEIAPLPGSDSEGPADKTGDTAQRTLRVEAAQIDRLLDIVAELVVAKNGLVHLAADAERGSSPTAIASAIRAASAATDRLIVDMHRAVMDVRMVSLDRLFRRLGRLVREIEARLGREVDFIVEGEATRVDKAIADALFEPLLHAIRNAIDHGIEPNASRTALGKPARGRLTLGARSLGDQILIEVADDGRGIDPARIRDIAVSRGLIEPEAAAELDDEAAMQLVFAPGFSTAETVSEVSGRGVGMDAVKAAVERLGGRVGLSSRAGAGTRVALHLPATAALTSVLVIGTGGERFAVPFDSIAETARIARDAVKPIGLGQAFVLRDRTLPLLDLARLLGLPPAPTSGDLKILVVDGGRGRVGIAVDSFSERLDVILRPMTGLLANMPAISGTSLFGDGSVLLILDLPEVIG
jgi:two-component system chemotaxis sensor kinase CheA